MTHDAPENAPKPRPERNFVPHFMFFMLLYLLVVHVWSLNIYPLGRDYAAMAGSSRLPWGAAQLFDAELYVFGRFLPGYHAVNLLLLYGCMVSVFFLTRWVLRGPWWLGSLAATLMMANPLKSEAVLNLSGVGELLPAFYAFAALAVYAWEITAHRPWKRILALALLALASWPFHCNASLFLVCLLAEWLIAERDERSALRAAAAALIGVAALCAAAASPLHTLAPSLALAMAPLYFVFYPIGLLPENTGLFRAVAPAACWLVLLLLIAAAWRRRGQRRPLLFGLLSACAVRLLQGDPDFDLVHLLGGGAMLVPIALMNIAFAACCRRIIQHPKWLRPMIFLTSVLCLAFFGLQIRSNLLWNYAGNQVRAFQQAAEQCRREHPGTPPGVLRAYELVSGAPMMLSSAITYDTPFSRACPHYRLLPLSCHPGQRFRLTAPSWSAKEGRVLLQSRGTRTLTPLTTAYPLADRYRCLPWRWRPRPVTPDPLYEVISATGSEIELRFTPRIAPLSPIVPFTPADSWLF